MQWAVSHPGLARRVVAMTPMAKTHPWAALVVEAARRALTADPEWGEDGFGSRPVRGWAAYTALMTALLARTPAAVQEFALDAGAAQRWLAALTEQNEAGGFDALSSRHMKPRHVFAIAGWWRSHRFKATRLRPRLVGKTVTI